VAACAIAIAPRDDADASPSARSTSGPTRDADPSSDDDRPACYTANTADRVADGLAQAPIAAGFTILIDGVASDCTAPMACITDTSSTVRPSPARLAMDVSTVAVDRPNCTT
jgi:hypothetical protein